MAKPFLLKTLVSDCNLQEALVIIYRFKEAFPMLATLYSAAVTIGVSSSTCENTFSTLTRVLRPQQCCALLRYLQRVTVINYFLTIINYCN